jgi:O-antigen/teichoic acid export membrane protein
MSSAPELSRREHPDRDVVGPALAISLLLGLAGALVLLPVDYALADQGFRKVAFVALGLPAVLIVQTLTAALIAVGRLTIANFLQFLLPVATVGGMVLFVVGLGRGTTGAVFAWVIAQFVVAAVGLIAGARIWLPLSVRSLPGARIRSMFMLGLRLGIVNLVSLLNYRVELVILELNHGLAAVGIYSLATSLAELLWVVSSALATATVAPVVSAPDDRAAAQIVARAVRGALIGTAVAGVVVAIGAIFFLVPIFGFYFKPSLAPLLILIPATIAFAPGSIISVWFSMRMGTTRYPLRISIVSLVVTTVTAIILIPHHFAIGAAESAAAGYIVGMTAGLYWFSRQASVPKRELVPRPNDLRVLAGIVRGISGR